MPGSGCGVPGCDGGDRGGYTGGPIKDWQADSNSALVATNSAHSATRLRSLVEWDVMPT